MPELPEISHFKAYTDEALLHRKVVDIAYGAAKPLQDPKQTFTKSFKDHTFSTTRRIGKYLFVKSDSEKWLVIHFGMSGWLDFSRMTDLHKHAIITFYFSDNSHFSFICPRKFGKVWIADSVEDFQKAHELGPDALDLNKSDFMKLMDGQTGGAKSVLMDQHKIAGIGNVYSDEILYQSHIHPKSKVSDLSKAELEKLYANISKVLKKGVEIIDKDKKPPAGWLKSHREEGADCPGCKGKVSKTSVGGRTTYFCDKCQKKKD